MHSAIAQSVQNVVPVFATNVALLAQAMFVACLLTWLLSYPRNTGLSQYDQFLRILMHALCFNAGYIWQNTSGNSSERICSSDAHAQMPLKVVTV